MGFDKARSHIFAGDLRLMRRPVDSGGGSVFWRPRAQLSRNFLKKSLDRLIASYPNLNTFAVLIFEGYKNNL